MNAAIIALIGYYAGLYGIDPNLALAVAEYESSFNVNAVGSHGEIGLFQIMPSVYPDKTTKQLFNPKTNVELGIKHLAWNKKYCKHKENMTWLVCYNYGIKNAERVKHPTLFPYYKEVMSRMEKFKQGQKVMVKNLHHNKVDGEGVYLGVSKQKGFEGYYRIHNEYGFVMMVEPDRVSDFIAYWEKKKN